MIRLSLFFFLMAFISFKASGAGDDFNSQTHKGEKEAISVTFRRVMEKFSQGEGKGSKSNKRVTVIKEANATFYGIDVEDQDKISFKELKREIQGAMGLETSKLIQLVGDSKPFSAEGSLIAQRFVNQFFEGSHMIEYGFTGHIQGLKLDVNSLLSTYIEDHPDQAYRVLANLVGHSIIALENWGCTGSDRTSQYVMVFNAFGIDDAEKRFTKFGDDVISSDSIMFSEDGDLLVMIEGGAQSFKQAVNTLKNGIPIKGLFNIREIEDRRFFSASEFLFTVQSALTKNPNISSPDVKSILDKYMETHEAWDKTRADAETKEKLFYSTMEEFIDQGIYKKLIEKVEISSAQ